MSRIRTFFTTAVLGGVLVVLPAAVMLFVIVWLAGLVAKAVAPVTDTLVDGAGMQYFVAVLVTLVGLTCGCFLLGLAVRTRLGGWLFALVERNTLKRVPGYSLVKETVAQLIGGSKSPFSTVALVQVFGNDTLVSAFVTDTHADGTCTVFVPTGPNPTSGNIYHLPGRFVHPVDVPVEEAMRSIISCGAGSKALLTAHRNTGEAAAVD